MLDEDQVGNIFEHLRIGIDLETSLADGLFGTLDTRLVPTGFLHQPADCFGVKFVQAGTPLEITVARHRVAVARGFPALDVLAAHGDLHYIVGLRSVTTDHFGHATAVKQFARNGLAGFVIHARVFGIRSVDRGDCAFIERVRHLCFSA